VTGLHFHNLRGTPATRAGEQGAVHAEIMRLLRDKTHTAALRYEHATDERRWEIADRMGDLLDEAPAPGADVVQITPRKSRYSTPRSLDHVRRDVHDRLRRSPAVSEGGRAQSPTGGCLPGHTYSWDE
jgi:hypothetical protein